MPLRSAFDRLRSFTTSVREGLFGHGRKAFAQFDTFDALLTALGSDDQRTYTMAFLYFQEQYFRVARQIARKFRSRSDEDVMEALTDVLIAVRQRIRQNRPFTDEAHLKNYIWSVFKNKMIDQGRVRPGPVIVDVDYADMADDGTESEIDYLFINEAVMQGLEKISSGCKEKLLWVAEGHSYADIAGWKKSNPKGMKNQIRECREKLKDELLKLGITVDWPRKKPRSRKPEDPDSEADLLPD